VNNILQPLPYPSTSSNIDFEASGGSFTASGTLVWSDSIITDPAWVYEERDEGNNLLLRVVLYDVKLSLHNCGHILASIEVFSGGNPSVIVCTWATATQCSSVPPDRCNSIYGTYTLVRVDEFSPGTCAETVEFVLSPSGGAMLSPAGTRRCKGCGFYA
jgi:hypothetical protein